MSVARVGRDMTRLVRSVLLAIVLVLLSAAPGAVVAADPVPVDAGTAVDAAPQMSAGLPVVRNAGGSSVSDRGVACSRPVVRLHPVLIAVLPPPVVDRPPAGSVSVEVVQETVAGTAGGCATGRAPPAGAPTSH